MERENLGRFKLDAIVTVIDAENFIGYEDISPTAKMQAAYTDVILINKWEHVSERALDIVMDHLHTLNDFTPKIRCNGAKGVDPNLIFGIDSNLFSTSSSQTFLPTGTHNDEVETITVWRGPPGPELTNTCCDHDHSQSHLHLHESSGSAFVRPALTEELLTSALWTLPKESIWRVKGFIRLTSPPGLHILNWAFGRAELTPFEHENDRNETDVRFTVMGETGQVKGLARKFAGLLGAGVR